MTDPIRAHFDIRRSGFSLQVALDMPGRGVTALFGHSGSGKTTLLRAIAGLERHPGGVLEVAGETWQDERRKLFVPTHRRALGVVFQEASLFPHLSVRGNLDFACKRAGGQADDAFLAHALDLLGIAHLLERPATDLSGGERQRVAIARALLTRPRLLLMDEPLASLDGRRKEEVLPYLERIHTELDIPMLYVSHSVDEVARLADHVVLLDAGRVVASGATAPTLARLDLSNGLSDDAGVVLEGVVTGFDSRYDLLHLDAGGGTVFVAHKQVPAGTRQRLRILARDVSLALSRPVDSSILNQLQVRIDASWPASSSAHVIVKLDAGGAPLLARITRLSFDQIGLAVGKTVWAQVKAVALLSLPS